jgi:phosphatidylglycerol:prolipoprotein diacylglycerol transferase
MLVYPSINPIIIELGPIKIHWYGLMYLIGFMFAWLIAHYRCKKLNLAWTAEQISDLIFYSALGIILGGRTGYMLFYAWQEFSTNPLILFKIWQGGMSFHGGLVGGLIALGLFARHHEKPFLEVTDFTAPLVPLGLAAGRIGNFINGELWGKPSELPWAMIFPHVDGQARHPSQLYEFSLEGILLFLIIFVYTLKPRSEGRATALFLILYGCFRCTIEFFREPDAQVGYIYGGWLTMGQLLSIPLIILGITIGVYQQYHARVSKTS